MHAESVASPDSPGTLPGAQARGLSALLDRFFHPPTVGPLRAVGAAVIATAMFLPFRSLLGQQQWGLPYLLVVGFVAGVGGVLPAIVTAILAFLAWNFCFIPPYYTLHVARADDLTYLFTFLVVAVALGVQTGRLRDREESARRGERNTSTLYRLSAQLVSERSLEAMARSFSAEASDRLGASGVVIWVPDVDGSLSPIRWPGDGLDSLVAQGRDIVERDSFAAAFPGQTFLPLETAAGTEGVLQIRWSDERETLSVESAGTLEAGAHLVAAYVRSRRLEQKAIRAEAARETERLRSALVSSVSHEFKTPLASLTANVSDLLEQDIDWEPERVRDKLDAALEDLERLDGCVADMLDASRLEARTWQSRPEELEIGEIVADVASRLPARSRGRLEYGIPVDLPTILADFVQVARAIRNVVDNALRYSDDQVELGAATPDEQHVDVWVRDRGPGISDLEKPQVFDKFYRGEAGRGSRSSTGLGLSITRDLITANGGHVRIEDAEGGGARVVARLPRASARDMEVSS